MKAPCRRFGDEGGQSLLIPSLCPGAGQGGGASEPLAAWHGPGDRSDLAGRCVAERSFNEHGGELLKQGRQLVEDRRRSVGSEQRPRLAPGIRALFYDGVAGGGGGP